jgi:hypothetical protein
MDRKLLAVQSFLFLKSDGYLKGGARRTASSPMWDETTGLKGYNAREATDVTEKHIYFSSDSWCGVGWDFPGHRTSDD